MIDRAPSCQGCGEPAEMSRRKDARGNWQILWGCVYCDKRVGTDFIPRHKVNDNDLWGLHELPASRPTDREQCPVCRELALLEEHHLAPKEVFGPTEADRWPTARVCRLCHERWHAAMGLPISALDAKAAKELVTRWVTVAGRLGYVITISRAA